MRVSTPAVVRSNVRTSGENVVSEGPQCDQWWRHDGRYPWWQPPIWHHPWWQPQATAICTAEPRDLSLKVGIILSFGIPSLCYPTKPLDMAQRTQPKTRHTLNPWTVTKLNKTSSNQLQNKTTNLASPSCWIYQSSKTSCKFLRMRNSQN